MNINNCILKVWIFVIIKNQKLKGIRKYHCKDRDKKWNKEKTSMNM